MAEPSTSFTLFFYFCKHTAQSVLLLLRKSHIWQFQASAKLVEFLRNQILKKG